MKKLEKFFKNTNITIDKEHKENIRKEILKNYNSTYSIKNKIFTFKTLSLSFVSTASVIIIIFVSIIVYNSFNKKPIMNQESNKFYKNEKDKVFSKLDETTLSDKLSPKSELDRKKEIKPEIAEQKGKSQFEGQILLANLEEYNVLKKSTDKSEGNELNSINEEKKSRAIYKEKKFDDISKSKEIEDQESDILNKSIKNDLNLVPTSNFNHIILLPNTKTESFRYLLNKITTKSTIDTSKINEAEVINYFTEKSIKNLNPNEIIAEITYFLNDYFVFFGFNNSDIIKNSKIEIEFKQETIEFYIAGYPIKQRSYNKKTENYINYNRPVVLLLKVIINNNPDINQEIVNIKFSYINKLKNQVQFDKKILFSNTQPIEDVNKNFKMALLGYMIASEIKNKNYSVNQIITFKNKYFSEMDFDADIQKIFKNRYH